MRKIFLLPLCLFVGCATHPREAKVRPAAPTGQEIAAGSLHPQVVSVETCYDVAGYFDPADPAVWHTAHAIYRATQVARRQAPDGPPDVTGPLTTYVPASYDPLPPSTELAAELAEQRQITSELRVIKARMLAIQTQAQAQFGQLVTDREASDQLRQKLEGEWTQLKEREANMPGVTPSAVPPQASTPEIKW